MYVLLQCDHFFHCRTALIRTCAIHVPYVRTYAVHVPHIRTCAIRTCSCSTTMTEKHGDKYNDDQVSYIRVIAVRRDIETR